MANRILFLDIDGVLNTEKNAEVSEELLEKVHNQIRRLRIKEVHRRLQWLHPELVERVNQVLDASEAKVVVSSTWRKLHTKEELQILLGSRGLKHEIYDMTPELPARMSEIIPRDREIEAWLQNHPEVKNYVILDDAEIKNYLRHVWIDPFEGITSFDVERALYLFDSYTCLG